MDLRQNPKAKEGRLLAEFFKVLYKGKDVKSEMQYGTIIVKNRKYHHYLYNVKDIDGGKPPITSGELTLTGPSVSPIACPSGYLRVEVDLFFGTYKKAFRADWLRSRPDEQCFYGTKKIEVQDKGEIVIHYGIFCNAVEAHVEVRLTPEGGFGGYVTSVVAAHKRKDDPDSMFSSSLLSVPGSSKVVVQSGEPIMLNRSIVAVPLGHPLHLDIELSNGDQHTIKFDVNDTEEKPVGKKDYYTIAAKVIWNPIHKSKPELNEICYYSDECVAE